jgi:ribonuclease HII
VGLAKVSIQQEIDRRLQFEIQARASGHHLVAGLDEAGRGPLAGPVVAACVILPEDCRGLEDLDDSKKLTARKRRELFLRIHERAPHVGVGIVDAGTIDRINILQASFLAMRRAVAALSNQPDFLLIDGNQCPEWADKAQCLVGGESQSLSIAAASIVAKETRDLVMCDYDRYYPLWGFAQHKGYGTEAHLNAMRRHGICDLHRRSFNPVRQLSLAWQK